MTNTVTIELPEADARAYAALGYLGNPTAYRVQSAVRAALPPEYPEGTFARVTLQSGHTYFAEMVDGYWSNATGVYITVKRNDVTRVEVIPTLADDEIAVKRPEVPAPSMRYVAGLARNEHYLDTAEWLTAVAAAMEKK